MGVKRYHTNWQWVGVKRYYTYWQWVSRGTILTGSGCQEVYLLAVGVKRYYTYWQWVSRGIILTGGGCQEVLYVPLVAGFGQAHVQSEHRTPAHGS